MIVAPGLLVEAGVGWSAVLLMLTGVVVCELGFGIASARASTLKQ
ncbi:hypothetical protein [Leucobacter sp. NPDC077196]